MQLAHLVAGALVLTGCATTIIAPDGEGAGATAGSGGAPPGSTATSADGVSVSVVTATSGAGEGGAGGDGDPTASSVMSSAATGFGGGTPLTGDVLDPAQVYLVGTLSEGACYADALVHWSAPDHPVVGFDCYFDGATARVRPADGRLVYMNTFEWAVREFVCDDCSFQPGDEYPAAPLANDPAHPMPPCSDEDVSVPSFVMSPDGERFHTCALGWGPWYDARGLVVLDGGEQLIHVGHDRLGLTESGSLVDLATSETWPIVGWPPFAVHTARALPAPDAFLIVADDTPTGEYGGQELWKVDRAGVATRVGAYPPLPPETTRVEPWSSRLEGSGALLQLGRGLGDFRDVIVRRELGGSSAVVYDEVFEPLVKLHISYLMTGP